MYSEAADFGTKRSALEEMFTRLKLAGLSLV